MKINTVKFIFAIAIAILLGLICEIVAPETDNKNWISFGMAFASIAAGLIPAIGLTFQNAKRGVSIKVFSWILTVALIATNVIFACFEYKVDVYLVVTLLIAILGWVVIYGLFSAKSAE